MEAENKKMVLLEIKEQLGVVAATTTAIKEDIAELKQKDVEADEKLEKAYAKATDYARTRQDKIRDDLQHQIDGNKTLILTINESIRNLSTSFEKMTADLKESLSLQISEIETRVKTLETKKEKTLAKWYDRIVDKLTWIFIVGAIVVLLKWLNAPTEIVNQLPH